MDKDEYSKRVTEMDARHKKERDALVIEYAKANNPYKVGDILKTDNGTIIRVEKITYSRGSTFLSESPFPYCNYEGPALKKDLTPRKVSPTRGYITQPRVKEKLSE